MDIGISTIKRMMRKGTGMQISTDAAYYLSTILEQYIAEKAEEAEKLLEKRNEARSKNGLTPRKRISKELLKELIENELAFQKSAA